MSLWQQRQGKPNLSLPTTPPWQGGLIMVKDRGTIVNLTNATLRHGVARFGGAAFVQGGTLHMVESMIDACDAIEFGGGVYLSEGATASATDTIIQHNRAHYGGGGIYVEGMSTFIATATVIANNSAQDQGGALFAAIGKNNIVLDQCYIASNLASGLGSGQDPHRYHRYRYVQNDRGGARYIYLSIYDSIYLSINLSIYVHIRALAT